MQGQERNLKEEGWGVFIFPMLGVLRGFAKVLHMLGVLRGFAKVWGKGKSLGGAGDFEGICKGIAHPLKPLGSLVSLNY